MVREPVATPAITGVVLDETGAPVRGVEVKDGSANGGHSAVSERDGTFELRRWQWNADAIARLRLYSHSWEIEPDQVREVAWGTGDVELRVVRAGALTLRVTDAAHDPVEVYSVRLIPQNRGRSSSDDSRVRAHGAHEDGTVTIEGLARGDWLLLVDFPAATELEPLFEPFSHDVIGPRRMDLRAAAAARRWLRVVDADGAPIAGSVVQLCELFGTPFDDARYVMRRDRWLMNSGNDHAMALLEGETGADGTLELRGPGGRELGLCLLGPGHVPQRQAGVRLDAEGELVVRVQRGARLTGKLVPEAALAELKRLAGVDPAGSFPRYRPSVELRGPSGPALQRSPFAADDLPRLFVADDGSFDIDGLPPGSWQVQVQAWIAGPVGATGQSFDAGTVVLVDGQTLHRDLDLESVLPGTLEGVVLLNGAPLANATVTLRKSDAVNNLQTDADGRFTRTCFSGEYELIVQRRAEGNAWSRLHCPSRVHVVRGQTTRQTFAISSSTLQVALLGAGGKPVQGVAVAVQGSMQATALPPTGADGRSEGELTAENVTLRILPKRLTTQEAHEQLFQQAQARGDRDPFGPHWITLATVALAPGQAQAVELRLPADSGY